MPRARRCWSEVWIGAAVERIGGPGLWRGSLGIGRAGLLLELCLRSGWGFWLGFGFAMRRREDVAYEAACETHFGRCWVVGGMREGGVGMVEG